MKTLSKDQAARLERAVSRIDDLMEKRPPMIPDEITLAAMIHTFDTVVDLLSAGQTIYIGITNEDGHSVALAKLTLEPANG
jgi:hypothetical protein